MDLNVSGFGGGTVLGGSFTLVEEPVDETALLCRLFTVYNQCHTWPSITEGEEASLYTDTLRSQLRGRAFDSLAYEVARQTADTLCRRAEVFKFVNHDLRFIHNFLIFNNSHFENSRPFYDYSVVELAYALPPSIKQDKRLLRRLINQVAPELAMVPYDKDNQLVTDRHLVRAGHDVIQRAKQWVNRHIHPTFDRRFTLYANYEHYLRSSLKAWGESILFDKRTLDRGIFNPDFLHSLWDRHQSGRERHTIGKIAPIMSYEMMLRRFYD
jgi:asparagine synthase (glutamine-hydrolysing)